MNVYETRIVEVNGEMIVPLPQEMIGRWNLEPGMALEYTWEGRSLLLKPPSSEAPAETSQT
ncbi:hypothetical protein [Pseudacidovorax sp. NFM-22]|uniref:hypothetical protein n=1 Tax=Pseudacidovorax sp. NFM-22 TaxID=2744469 RepID=UPI001F4618DF|nr:hypothetical protein [Pseudacidovorax sp. NFM-22]